MLRVGLLLFKLLLLQLVIRSTSIQATDASETMMPKKLKSKLILCNIPTVESERARQFYTTLLGTDFARGPTREVESYHTPLSRDGIDLTITTRYDDQEGITCYFAVDNLDRAIEELVSLGGEVKQPAMDVSAPDTQDAKGGPPREQGRGKQKQTAGRMAIVLDPDRNSIGLMELSEFSQAHFKYGKHQEGLDDALVREFEKSKGAGDAYSRG